MAPSNNTKALWWSVTAFNDSEIGKLENRLEFPDWVECIHGGREECPETKRLHFQGAIQCRRQMRFNQVKKWLPTAHLEVARNPSAIKKYALKPETAVGPKDSIKNPEPNITINSIMIKLAEWWDNKMLLKLCELYEDDLDKAVKECYWYTVRQILQYNPSYRKVCHLFARADVVTLWKHTRSVWIDLEKRDEGISITPSHNEVLPPVNFSAFSTEWSGNVNEVVNPSENLSDADV